MTTRISIKFTYSDGTTGNKSFDKIGGTISLDSAKNLAKVILPLVGAISADVTVSNYNKGQVES